MSMRLAMKASLESAALDEKAKQKELRKAKKEAKRARKAELAALYNWDPDASVYNGYHLRQINIEIVFAKILKV